MIVADRSHREVPRIELEDRRPGLEGRIHRVRQSRRVGRLHRLARAPRDARELGHAPEDRRLARPVARPQALMHDPGRLSRLR